MSMRERVQGSFDYKMDMRSCTNDTFDVCGLELFHAILRRFHEERWGAKCGGPPGPPVLSAVIVPGWCSKRLLDRHVRADVRHDRQSPAGPASMASASVNGLSGRRGADRLAGPRSRADPTALETRAPDRHIGRRPSGRRTEAGNSVGAERGSRDAQRRRPRAALRERRVGGRGTN